MVTDPGPRLGRHLWVHHAGWPRRSWSRSGLLNTICTELYLATSRIEHCNIVAGMHKVACCRGGSMQQLVSCQRNMGNLERAKPLAVFIQRDFFNRCIENLARRV